ncbi:MAG: WD40 repeat domain-containing protein [Hyphomonadaceae bacterium]
MRGVTARVYTNGKRLALGAGATSVHWAGGEALFALGDGAVLAAGAETRRIPAHDGAILSAAPHPDGARLVTGGDDGVLKLVSPAGDVETLASLGGKWVDHLTASAVSKIIVAGAGKQAIVFRDGAEAHRFTYPSTVGGLALDAKGRRLAASHYGGANVRLALAADDKGTDLKWAGSHLAVTLSPDADYVVTAMQENVLHGWRLPDKTDLQMTGYPAKTRSFSWSKNARWLATSGADRAVIWPFAGKLGPQGKPPLMIGERAPLVTAVAFHPSEEALAIGYGDGAVLLARLNDEASAEIDEPGGGAVSALSWRADGKALAFGDEAGRGGIVSF